MKVVETKIPLDGASSAEMALRDRAKQYSDEIRGGGAQVKQEKKEGMRKFKKQMQAISARREEQITGWKTFSWADKWGDDTMMRSIKLAATNSWSHSPRYGYA